MRTPIPEEMNTVCASNTPRKSPSCILRCNCCQVVAFRHVDVLVIQSSHLGTEMMEKRGQCSDRNTGKHRHCVQVSPSSKDEESAQYFDLQRMLRMRTPILRTCRIPFVAGAKVGKDGQKYRVWHSESSFKFYAIWMLWVLYVGILQNCITKY